MKFEKKLLGFAIVSMTLGSFSVSSLAGPLSENEILDLTDKYSNCYYNGLTSSACDTTDAAALVADVLNAATDVDLAIAQNALSEASEGQVTGAYADYYYNASLSDIEVAKQAGLQVDIDIASQEVNLLTAQRDDLALIRDQKILNAENSTTTEDIIQAREELLVAIENLSQGEIDLSKAQEDEIIAISSLENSINSKIGYDAAADSALVLIGEVTTSPLALAQEALANATNDFESAEFKAVELEGDVDLANEQLAALQNDLVTAEADVAGATQEKNDAEQARNDAAASGDIDSVVAATAEYTDSLLNLAEKNLDLNKVETDLEILKNEIEVSSQAATDARDLSDQLLDVYVAANEKHDAAEAFALSDSPAVGLLDNFIKLDTPEGAPLSGMVGAIDENFGLITSETERAMGAEQVNATAIATETERAMGAEQVNATAIATETERAMVAEQANANAINANTGLINSNTGLINSNTESLQKLEMQLNEDVDMLKSGIASALAIAGMPIAGGEGMGFSAGLGYFEGESAVSLGLSYVNEGTIYKLGVGHSGESTSASAGVAFKF